MSESIHIHWFRRDLRLEDHRGLQVAVRSGRPILPLFIFDRNILDGLNDRADRRVAFIYHRLKMIRSELESAGSALLVRVGKPVAEWKRILEQFDVGSVTYVHDYEPYAVRRDREVDKLLKRVSIPVYGVKDQVIFETNEILNGKGEPYKVFTPYAVQWKNHLGPDDLVTAEVPRDRFYRTPSAEFPELEHLGFRMPQDALTQMPSSKVSDRKIKAYYRDRDKPSLDGTTRLGIHLRFGTVSVRRLVARALKLSDKLLDELIWREFYQMALWHNPESPDKAIRPDYDRIEWEDNPAHFRAWCKGRTGYPFVDAGMRQLNQTGFMHNRLRMVTASFLVKHLLIDWRKGERYFAEKLLDYDLASNVGGWQWVAGSGHDASPYFRIFNPVKQQKRFDPEQNFTRFYIPELESSNYPEPVIEHRFARKRALERYRSALE